MPLQLADINNKYTELMDVYEALGIEINEPRQAGRRAGDG